MLESSKGCQHTSPTFSRDMWNVHHQGSHPRGHSCLSWGTHKVDLGEESNHVEEEGDACVGHELGHDGGGETRRCYEL